jgi:hypothetical protein
MPLAGAAARRDEMQKERRYRLLMLIFRYRQAARVDINQTSFSNTRSFRYCFDFVAPNQFISNRNQPDLAARNENE